MTKRDKLIEKIMSGEHDRNISFAELKSFLDMLGFIGKNTGGSHIVFRKEGINPLNIQPSKDGKAKGYQLDQVRETVKKYNII